MAAVRIRMALSGAGSGSPTEIDRGWARIMADTLDTYGYRLVREPVAPFGGDRSVRTNQLATLENGG